MALRTLLGALLCATQLGLAPAATASSRIYQGDEAQALQCAAYFSYSAWVLAGRGLFTPRNADEGAIAATNILGRHVGGTYEQKRAAFQVALNRLPSAENDLIAESIRYLGWCREKFLS
jgi:hypothetical protein